MEPYGVYVKKLGGKRFQLTINGRTFGAVCDLDQNIKPLGDEVKTTEVYTHVMQKDLNAVASPLDSLMNQR